MKDELQLIEAYLDGELSGEEEARLDEWLRGDPDHLRVFVREAHLQRQLREAFRARQFQRNGVAASGKAESAPPDRSAERPELSLRVLRFPEHAVLRYLVPLAACIALLLSILLVFSHKGPVLTEVNGAAGVKIERNGRVFSSGPVLRLRPGDRFKTASNSMALITYPHEMTRIIVSSNTEVSVLAAKGGKQFHLGRGRIEAMVAHQSKKVPMLWQTAQAQAMVVGTELALEAVTNQTRLEVLNGAVRFISLATGESVLVGENQSSVAAPGSRLELQEYPWGRGTTLREIWLGIGNVHIRNLTGSAEFPDAANTRDYPTSFCGPTNWMADSGIRLRGYVHPPRTGVYTLWITGGDSAELFLSSDELAESAERVATLNQSAAGQWDKFSWQKSRPIKLEAGRKYYIEALFKESTAGADYGCVAWQPPGEKRAIIPGRFLSPFNPNDRKGIR